MKCISYFNSQIYLSMIFSIYLSIYLFIYLSILYYVYIYPSILVSIGSQGIGFKISIFISQNIRGHEPSQGRIVAFISIHLSTYISIYPSLHLFHLSTYLSIYPSIHLCINLSIHLYTFPSIYYPIYLLQIYVSTYISIYQSMYPSIYLATADFI